MNTNADRMKSETPGVSSIMWEPWVDLPEWIMRKDGSWRDWNDKSRLRDEANRQKIEQALLQLQKKAE